jgi:mannose-6-phosphate isomerase class I
MHGESIPVRKGDTLFIPAQNSTFTVSGTLELILASV